MKWPLPTLALTAALLLTAYRGPESPIVEILWDDWGIPHVRAGSDAHLAYGLAWAQMRNHGNLILTLYGRSSGRGAELWGETYLASDRYVWTMDIPRLADAQYAALPPGQRALIDAFASGINDYAAAHGTALDDDLERILPIDGHDVLRHAAYALYFNGLVLSPPIVDAAISRHRSGEGVAQEPAPAPASNGWAIGPAKSRSGRPLLLSNTHFPWPGLAGYEHLLWHEAQLTGRNLDVYGVGLIGLPALTVGFNDTKAWTITATSASTFDKVDFYALTRVGDGYRFDDAVLPFEEREHTLKIRNPDGSLGTELLTLRRSIHGPVVYADDHTALAVRIALPSQVLADDLWNMARADTPQAFLTALAPGNLPPLNVLYGDAAGNILYTLAGTLPDRRLVQYDPSEILPGESSANLWYGALPQDRLPLLLNPASGFLQNTNDPPWTATLPGPLDPADYPSDWQRPAMSLRTALSLKMLLARDRFTHADVVTDKYSTHAELADRVLDDLIAVARATPDARAQQAASVLAAWDRGFNADSRGAVLFAFWALELEPAVLQGQPLPDSVFATPFDPLQPLDTPRGLADPVASVTALIRATEVVGAAFGSLYVPWGELLRFRVGAQDLPGFGAPGEAFGVFSANAGALQPDGRLAVVAGDTWVFVIDYDDPRHAMAVSAYGNASAPDAPANADQLSVYAGKRLRPIWRDRRDIETHLVERELLRPECSPRRPARNSCGPLPVQRLNAR